MFLFFGVPVKTNNVRCQLGLWKVDLDSLQYGCQICALMLNYKRYNGESKICATLPLSGQYSLPHLVGLVRYRNGE